MKPTETIKDDGDRKREHPSFAQIQASRVSGKKNLYGSEFKHHHYVVVEIAKSTEYWHNVGAWHHATGGAFVSVAMTEAQWAEFVSSMNVGSGACCTIEHARVGDIEQFPPVTPLAPRADEYKRDLKEMHQSAVTALHEALKAARDRKAHSSIINGIETAIREIDKNTPFVEKRFAEHIEELVEEAKVEAAAYLNHAIKTAGIEAIQDRGRYIGLEKK